jgi:hypothetical protein
VCPVFRNMAILSSPRLVRHTQEHGRAAEYTREPAPNTWRRLKVKLLALLPIAREP